MYKQKKRVYGKFDRGLFEIPPCGRNDSSTYSGGRKGQTRRQQAFVKRNNISRRVCPFCSPHIAQSFRMEHSGMRNLFHLPVQFVIHPPQKNRY